MGQGQGTQQLEERYYLQKVKLGQGSFGTVWRAGDRQYGMTVAIKQLEKASLPRRGVTRSDIEREISLMKACNHDNITKLYDTFEDQSSIYMALEYCDCGDFGDKVKERGMSIQEPEVAEWMRQMSDSICHLHSRGICHRDIKPDNFMVMGDLLLKLSDFGLAVFLPRGHRLQEKCGTPAFMAPEQHHLPKRSPGYGFAADMWAAGVSMYMVMFGGKHPFLTNAGGLDDDALLSGTLEFREGSKFGGVGGFLGLNFGGQMRFSEEARAFCKSMVEPNQEMRMTAEEAVRNPWLKLGMCLQKAPAGPPAISGQLPPQAPTPARGSTPRHSPTSRSHSGEVHAPPPPRSRTPHGEAPPFPSAAAAAGAADRKRAATPGPEGRKALEQAAKLQDENSQLQAQLEEGRRREEELVRAKREQERRLLESEQQRLQLQKIQEQKELAERQRLLGGGPAERGRPPAGPADVTEAPSGERAAGRRHTAMKGEAVGRSKSGPLDSDGQRRGLLRPGVKCRYESASYGWLPAVVRVYNADGTYDLDVRPHAALDKIAPASDVRASEAWPPGTLAAYHSSSANNQWLPATVVSFNENDGTYNLDVRDHADCDRIRARVERPAEEVTGVGSSSGSRPSAKPWSTEGHQPGEMQGGASPSKPSKVPSGRDVRGTELEEPGSRRVGVGDCCVIEQHGLAIIEASQDGTFTADPLLQRGRKRQVPMEAVRAPAELKFAWPKGMKVSYWSPSSGQWIPSNVVSFNQDSCTYNLDVRQEAPPDRVRPR